MRKKKQEPFSSSLRLLTSSLCVSVSLWLIPILLASVTNHVCEDAVCAGDACTELPVPHHACVDIVAATVISREQSAAQSGFARIIHRERRAVMRVPRLRVIKPALLNPASEITLRNLVRKVQERVLRFSEFNGRVLVRDARVSERDRKGRKLRTIHTRVWIPLVRFVVEDNECAARLNVIQKTRVQSYEFRVSLIAAIVYDDRTVTAKVTRAHIINSQLLRFNIERGARVLERFVKACYVAAAHVRSSARIRPGNPNLSVR